MTERQSYKCKKCGKILLASRGMIRYGCARDLDIHHIDMYFRLRTDFRDAYNRIIQTYLPGNRSSEYCREYGIGNDDGQNPTSNMKGVN